MGVVDAADSAGPAKKPAGPEAPAQRSGSRAAVILGNDAVVAARPYSPAQLSRACASAGFDIVIPPSWGDELVADGYLAALADRRDHVVVACTCARVTALLAQSAGDQPGRVAVVAPPVAAARYLRLVYGDGLLVTYVGDCPAASDASIDARFTPAGFFASLHRQGVSLSADAVDPEQHDMEAERWKRYRSIPGGLPALRFLARPPVDRVLREVNGQTFMLDTWQRSRSRVLLDLAEAAGCACAGHRAQIDEYEPARSATPILVQPPGLDLKPQRTPIRRRGTASPPQPPSPVATPARDQNSASIDRAIPLAPVAATPVDVKAPAARSPEASKHFPTRAPIASEAGRRVAGAPHGNVSSTPNASTPNASPPRRTNAEIRRTDAMLAAIPPVVLVISAALGMAVYLLAGDTASNESAAAARERSALTGETAAHSDTISRGRSRPARPSLADSSGRTLDPSVPRTTDRIGTAPTRDSGSLSAKAAVDSASAARIRPPRRRQAPQIIPGWLPQGQKAWTPADTIPSRRPDSSDVTPPKPGGDPRA